MADISSLISIISAMSNTTTPNTYNSQPHTIPKELEDQYPYGQFPIRYTKYGQEELRKHSENRFSIRQQETQPSESQNNNIDLSSMLPLIQMLSNKQQPKDMFKILSKLLFKDNKELEKIFEAFPIKSQSIVPKEDFPNTQKINIQSLKRVT